MCLRGGVSLSGILLVYDDGVLNSTGDVKAVIPLLQIMALVPCIGGNLVETDSTDPQVFGKKLL